MDDKSQVEECQELSQWYPHQIDSMSEANFRRMVMRAIAELADRTEKVRQLIVDSTSETPD